MSTFSQLFPPAPTFTESALPDLSGRVYLITGSTSGVGLELAKMLFSRNATVYVAGRSSASASTAISQIKAAHPSSTGHLKPFVVDLSQLSSVCAAAEAFAAAEPRLDVLFLNAGVMTPPAGSKTADGYDLELGTNCLGPFLLARLLQPTLEATAARADGSSVRIVWVSSMVSVGTPEGGVQFDADGNPVQLKAMDNYMQSKAGDLFLSHVFSQRLASRHVMSVSLNPGLMKTELQRHSPPPQRVIMGLIFKGPKYGAYTELYAGFAPEVQTGAFYVPWGRRGCIPDHLKKSMEPSPGSKSVAERFYNWCEMQTRNYLPSA